MYTQTFTYQAEYLLKVLCPVWPELSSVRSQAKLNSSGFWPELGSVCFQRELTLVSSLPEPLTI